MIGITAKVLSDEALVLKRERERFGTACSELRTGLEVQVSSRGS